MIELKKDIQEDEITRNTLKENTLKHIQDVKNGMEFISDEIRASGYIHDHTKVSNFDEFYEALSSGKIDSSDWWKMHMKKERHHLNKQQGVPDDVNLIDVLEQVVDSVMAGLSRPGDFYEIKLNDELFQKAYKNTVELLKKNIKIVE